MSCPPYPSHGEEHAEEQIRKALEGELVYDVDDELEGELLLDDMEGDLSYTEGEFEEVCLFGRHVDLDNLGDSQEAAGVGVVGEADCADNVEEMVS